MCPTGPVTTAGTGLANKGTDQFTKLFCVRHSFNPDLRQGLAGITGSLDRER
jgi:hypothetical protein